MPPGEELLLTRAGLRQVDSLIANTQPAPDVLRDIVDRSHAACAEAVQVALGRTLSDGPLQLATTHCSETRWSLIVVIIGPCLVSHRGVRW